jgi:UDP-glucose 4-epimerase
MNILLAGGAGYIGSHAVVELVQRGHEVVIVDNLSNSSATVLERIKRITGKDVPFYEVDCANKAALQKVFAEHHFDAVMHFAGLKAVGESVSQPLRYYRNNIDSTLILCELMQEYGVKKLIFSSSATVYSASEELPLRETSQAGVGISNPYGRSKYIIEQILHDLAAADPSWQITVLRYFNPIGAHESGLIGEDPNGRPNNLLPFIAQVAVGKLHELSVYGNDYDTPDGTGVRDYIHVVDLAKGHIAALEHDPLAGEVATYNLGTGQGVSVLEMIRAFEAASGKTIPYKIVPRRPGDITACYADCTKANQQLGWHAEKTLQQACADTWRWQSQNPDGFGA